MVTLSRRFSAVFVLIVALPSLVISVVLARSYLEALYATVAKQNEATTEQVVQNIRAETDGVSIVASALVHDHELRSLADAYASTDDRGELYTASRRLDDKLVSFFSFSNRIGAVVLFMHGGRNYTYANYPSVRSPEALDRSLFADALKDPGKVVLLDTLDAVGGHLGADHVITIAVAPPPDEPSSLEALLLLIRVPYFDALAAGPGGEEGPDVVIVGRNGRALLSSVVEAGGTAELSGLVGRVAAEGGHEAPPFREMRAAGRAWLATVRPLESTGWTVAVLSDTVALSRRVTRYQWYLYPALGVLALLFLAYAELFFARIAAPIRAMVGHMGRVGQGDLAVRAGPHTIRELAELAVGFNRMVDETKRLQAERDRSERERLSAELDALRYQINPHFVANTLSSIRLLATAARADAIAGMTRDLMRVLSDSYSAAGKLTELSRELENVAAYVRIMKVRFGERFDLEMAPEPGVGSALALRMILQPIVENCILHGFGAAVSKGRRGTIRIVARFEERELPPPASPEPWAIPVAGRVLVVDVTDDGAGMTAERAAEVASGEAKRGGLSRIGVSNVLRRIQLNFGNAYGLSVESEPGAFTRVRFVLPALLREDERMEAAHA